MKFEFSEQQIQQIVNILAGRPYGEVYDLINNIQQQASQQPKPTLAAVPAPAEPNTAAARANAGL